MNPLALGMALTQLLIGGVSSYAQQKTENLKAQQEIQASNIASSFDLSTLYDQAQQTQRSNDIEIFDRQRQALKERSRLMVASGEAGVGGNTNLRLLANNMLDASYDIGIRQTNKENSIFQTTQQAFGTVANRDSRINQAQSNIRSPWLSSILGISQTAPQAFNNYQQLK